ncbi:hypothetical protein LEP1GSC086_1027, partial [Leptospira weilii str. LNT 1234]
MSTNTPFRRRISDILFFGDSIADRTRFGQTFTILERYSNDPKKRKVIKEKLKTYNLRTRPKGIVQNPKKKSAEVSRIFG